MLLHGPAALVNHKLLVLLLSFSSFLNERVSFQTFCFPFLVACLLQEVLSSVSPMFRHSKEQLFFLHVSVVSLYYFVFNFRGIFPVFCDSF